LALCGAMLLAGVVAFHLIRGLGEGLKAPPAPEGGGAVFLRVLAALAAIIVLGQVMARLFAYLRQPPVIGEVVAGILLGPSLLGPELSAWVLPPSVAPFLGVIAQLGVVLYMFLVGLELNPALLKHRARATLAISHASILVPFLLGALLALPLYPRLSSRDVPLTTFALFLGVAKAQVGQGLFVAAGALAYIAFMFFAARPALERTARRWDAEEPSRPHVALIFAALLLSALAAEAIGIHAIFGAFLFGAAIPHDSAVARALTRQLESVVTILLLPAFFALTGMRTRIDLLSEPSHWLICGLIIVVATLGKFGGAFAAARLAGMGRRDAAALGTLMNTRGLMELIVLNVGLDLGVISPALFAMMALMALATTALASPVLHWLKAREEYGEEEVPGEPPRARVAGASR
jgi:Kef-type K+ transport system membrane component KefB